MSSQLIYRCLALVSVLFLRDLLLMGTLSAQLVTDRQPPRFYRYRWPSTRPTHLTLPKEIIGKDNRQTVASGKAYPWTAIGRVFPGNCTATLVGEDLLLTNAHCVLDYERGGKNYENITFHPNVVNGQTIDSRDVAQATEAITGTNFEESNRYRHQYPGWRGISLGDSARDWALLKLDKPVGLKYGFWGWRAVPTPELVNDRKYKLAIAGYPYDFNQPGLLQSQGNTLAVQEGCSILKEERNMYYHDCDTAKGSSGSPIFYRSGRNHYMVALNNASNGKNNYAVNLRNLPETFLPKEQWHERIRDTAADDGLHTTVEQP
jgi:V8-like Glu-specific endopeptidase